MMKWVKRVIIKDASLMIFWNTRGTVIYSTLPARGKRKEF
uniref:Uncharacterized protein n=1 Tax=Romanomermis culicivorax TaxID=13658 RepID=A0A915JVF2_ROMCU